MPVLASRRPCRTGIWRITGASRSAASAARIVEATAVTRDGRITPGCTGIYEQSQIAGLREIVALYHDQMTPVGIQLAHAGRKASAAAPLEGAAPLVKSDPAQAWEAVAPSAIAMMKASRRRARCRTRRSKRSSKRSRPPRRERCSAGFDLVEIHGAHGYLIHAFFSPLSNQRTDQWGGSFENRMRFALAVARAVRKALPETMPLFYRTSSVDGIEGGVTIEDTIALARELKPRGVDVIDCSSGGIVGASGRALVPPSPGYLVPYAHRVRHEAQIATMAVGLIVTGKQAEEAVAGGSADLIAHRPAAPRRPELSVSRRARARSPAPARCVAVVVCVLPGKTPPELIMQQRFLICLIALVLCCSQAKAQDAPRPAGNDYASLIALFREFREFAPPRVDDGVPDYTAAAMTEQAARLKGFQQRLAAIDDSQWPVSERVDYMLVLAEMRGLEFQHRVMPAMAARPRLLQHDASRLRTEDPRRNGDSQAAAVRGGCSQLSRQARGRAEDTRAGAQQSHRCAGDLARLAIVQKKIERNVYDQLARDLARSNPVTAPEACARGMLRTNSSPGWSRPKRSCPHTAASAARNTTGI